MNIVIRVDAHTEIALGHLRRCIRLGQTLGDLGHNLNFVVYDDLAAKLALDEAGVNYRLIPYKINVPASVDSEVAVLAENSETEDILIIDSYSVDDEYIAKVNHFYEKIIYLDDLGMDFNVDMVINPSCKVHESDYVAQDVLRGMEYVILGDEYINGRQNTREGKSESILITMGGIDHYDLSSRVIPIFEEIAPDIEINIVIGPYYENIAQIRQVASGSDLKINYFEGLSNIHPVIMQSDLAITAGGFTTYELAAMGTPCVGIALWDNQKGNIECLSNKGALLPLYYHEDPKFDEELKESLSLLMKNKELRVTMSDLARSTIDGLGAKRISEEVTKRYG